MTDLSYGTTILISGALGKQELAAEQSATPNTTYQQGVKASGEIDTTYFLKWNEPSVITATYKFMVSPEVPAPSDAFHATNKAYVDQQIYLVSQVIGRPGADGKNGEKGEKGDPGVAGPRGIDGRNGIDGVAGIQGVNGKDGERGERGFDGRIGLTGPRGNDGKNGAIGKDGKSAYQLWLDAGNIGSENDFINSLKGETGKIDQTELDRIDRDIIEGNDQTLANAVKYSDKIALAANTKIDTENAKTRADLKKAQDELSKAIADSIYDDGPITARIIKAETTQQTDKTALTNQIQAAVSKVDGNIATVGTLQKTVADQNAAMSLRVDTLSAITQPGGDLDTNLEIAKAFTLAEVQKEAQARTTADQGVATTVDSVRAKTELNTSAISSINTALTTRDQAISKRFDTVTSDMGKISAQVSLDELTSASADEALGKRIDTVSAATTLNEASIKTTNTAMATLKESMTRRTDTMESTFQADLKAKTDAALQQANLYSKSRFDEAITLVNNGDTALAKRVDEIIAGMDQETAEWANAAVASAKTAAQEAAREAEAAKAAVAEAEIEFNKNINSAEARAKYDAALDAQAKADAALAYAQNFAINQAAQALKDAMTHTDARYYTTLDIISTKEQASIKSMNTLESSLKIDSSNKAATAKADATLAAAQDAKTKADDALAAAKADATGKADTAESRAKIAAAQDAKNKADAALADAKIDAAARALAALNEAKIDSTAKVKVVTDLVNTKDQAMIKRVDDLNTSLTGTITLKADAALAAASADASAKDNSVLSTLRFESASSIKTVTDLVNTKDAAQAASLNTVKATLQTEISNGDAGVLAGAKTYVDGKGYVTKTYTDAEIATTRNAQVTANNAQALLINAVTATANGNTASITTTNQAVADINGKLNATWGIQIAAGNRVAGIKLTSDGSTSAFKIHADQFLVYNGSADEAVFQVVNGKTFLKSAHIGSLTADNISAGSIVAKHLTADAINAVNAQFDAATIKNATISFAKISDDIQSSNYVPNAAGWKLSKNGTLSAQEVNISGNIKGSTITGSFVEGSVFLGTSGFLTKTSKDNGMGIRFGGYSDYTITRYTNSRLAAFHINMQLASYDFVGDGYETIPTNPPISIARDYKRSLHDRINGLGTINIEATGVGGNMKHGQVNRIEVYMEVWAYDHRQVQTKYPTICVCDVNMAHDINEPVAGQFRGASADTGGVGQIYIEPGYINGINTIKTMFLNIDKFWNSRYSLQKSFVLVLQCKVNNVVLPYSARITVRPDEFQFYN